MLKRHTLTVIGCAGLVCAMLFTMACRGNDGRYHWDNVPYCKVQPGQMSSTFVAPPVIRVLTRRHNGGGIGMLMGMTSDRSVVTSDQVLVALVTCNTATLRPDRAEVTETLTKEEIPLICDGQKTLVNPVVVKAQATTTPGFDGRLSFPQVPKNKLKCVRGTLAYGSGSGSVARRR